MCVCVCKVKRVVNVCCISVANNRFYAFLKTIPIYLFIKKDRFGAYGSETSSRQGAGGDGLGRAGARLLYKLESNYRSTANILRVGHSFLRGMSCRQDKTLRPTKADGARVVLLRCRDTSAQVC